MRDFEGHAFLDLIFVGDLVFVGAEDFGVLGGVAVDGFGDFHEVIAGFDFVGGAGGGDGAGGACARARAGGSAAGAQWCGL